MLSDPPEAKCNYMFHKSSTSLFEMKSCIWIALTKKFNPDIK